MTSLVPLRAPERHARAGLRTELLGN
jgi:hypothetical protein